MTFSLEELDAALRDVHDVLSPTPQLRWARCTTLTPGFHFAAIAGV